MLVSYRFLGVHVKSSHERDRLGKIYYMYVPTETRSRHVEGRVAIGISVVIIMGRRYHHATGTMSALCMKCLNDAP